MAKVRPISEGYEAAIPYLCVKEGSDAIAFYRRAGQFEDPFGHRWWLSTRKDDLSVDEMKSRAAKVFGGA